MHYAVDGKMPITVGPWGGNGGNAFDDGVFSTVRQLLVAHGSCIDSLQVEYDLEGTSVWSSRHGGNAGTKTDKIKLVFPDEVLTSVSGHYGTHSAGDAVTVRSLTFETNRTKYGPFGTQQGTHFSFPMTTGAKIVGFHGRCGWYLDAIGVYLKPLQKPVLSNGLSSSKSFFINHKNERTGFNVVQGSVGKAYDIVLAVREKEDNSKIMPKNYSRQLSRSISESFSDDEAKSNVVDLPGLPMKEPSATGGPVTYGPWGGNGGSIFDDGVYTGVRQVHLYRNVGVIAMRVQYDRNGLAVWGNKHGGSGSIKTDKIMFDYPYEVLTHISGYYGTTLLMGPTAVKSLTFHTTKGKYGPYGEEQGIFFTSNIKPGMIVGFHGRKGWYIDCIGVHVLEGKVSLPEPPINKLALTSTTITEVEHPHFPNKLVLAKRAPGRGEEVVYGIVKEPVPSGPGPWGGDGGRPWDDGVFSGIKQIFITRGQVITSIQIEYDRNGQSVWSTRHGAGGGEALHKIQFEYPNEVLNCISGYYGPITKDERPNVIRSLTFYTTRGKYGPYGDEIGTFFTSTVTEGKVVGLHGRSGLYLDAIGVHMQHWLGQRKNNKSLFSKFFAY